jgi:hypothetical protein
MSARRLLKLSLIGGVTLIMSLAARAAPREAFAQCGDTLAESSCHACHEQAHPAYERGEWHAIHAQKDCCWNCHGGNDQAADKDLAHAALVRNPLEDTYTSCHQCHPDDYRQRADRFAAILGVTPGSSEPVTHTVEMAAPGVGQPIVPPVVPLPASESISPWLWPMVLVTGALLLGLVLTWRRLSRPRLCRASYGHSDRLLRTGDRRIGFQGLRCRLHRARKDRTD